MSIRVSVIVPTFRRPHLVRRCLAALFAQDFPSSYEIIVVEDGAGEGTTDLIDAWAGLLETHGREQGRRSTSGRHLLDTDGIGEVVENESSTFSPPLDIAGSATLPRDSERGIGSLADARPRNEPAYPPVKPAAEESAPRRLSTHPATVESAGAPCLRYIPLRSRLGPAAARNVGWKQARGEIIAFTDDDCIPTPGWLRAGLAAFRPGVVAVSGHLVMPLSSEPTDYELNASNLQHSEFVTANCFYRRAALERVGGFDERFAEAWREDSDLIFTLMENVRGVVPFVHAPHAIVIHPVRPARWGISLQQQRKNVYNALLYKKHPSLYRQRLGRVTPWRYYVILIALLVCFAGMVTRQPVLALGAAITWMALTGLFCLQRLERTSRAPRHVMEMAITSILIPPVALYWRAKGALKYRVWFL